MGLISLKNRFAIGGLGKNKFINKNSSKKIKGGDKNEKDI